METWTQDGFDDLSNETDYSDLFEFFGTFMPLFKAYQFIQILSIVCYSITLIIGVIGNGLVIWVASFKMKTVSSVWFLNLAIADIICNLALPFRIVQWAMFWETYLDRDLCKFGMTVMFINMFSSVYFLTVISVDRCVSIMWPFWSRIYRTRRMASIVAACTWLLCLLSSVPHVVQHYTSGGNSDCFPKYDAWIRSDRDNQTIDKMFIIQNVCMFSFPFVLITISYILIIYKAKSLKRPKGSQGRLKVIIAIVLCFFICWFPYNTWPFVSDNIKYWKVNMIISEICVCLAYFNSCINPLVYVLFSQDFKKGFLKSMPARLENLFSERPDESTTKTSVELSTYG
ncbi:fMet-Leu-Phe receptor-like [Pyxicephalus adspersus]|uniref:fMet-Leu-Phe receptor-like n=1 Tax=Pyxicephalus adspersus TaxID=30357 RepID=UPI003B5BBBAA